MRTTLGITIIHFVLLHGNTHCVIVVVGVVKYELIGIHSRICTHWFKHEGDTLLITEQWIKNDSSITNWLLKCTCVGILRIMYINSSYTQNMYVSVNQEQVTSSKLVYNQKLTLTGALLCSYVGSYL